MAKIALLKRDSLPASIGLDVILFSRSKSVQCQVIEPHTAVYRADRQLAILTHEPHDNCAAFRRKEFAVHSAQSEVFEMASVDAIAAPLSASAISHFTRAFVFSSAR